MAEDDDRDLSDLGEDLDADENLEKQSKLENDVVKDLKPAKMERQRSSLRDSLRAPLERYMSTWIVDMEREKEGFTAGRCKTYLGLATGCLAVIVLTIGYILCFARIETGIFGGDVVIGYGDKIMTALIATGQVDRNVVGQKLSTGFAVTCATILGWVFVYMFDVRNWHGLIVGLLGKFIMFFCVSGSFVSALLVTNEFPAAPFMAYVVLAMLTIAGIKQNLFPDVQKLFYLRTMTWITFICGIIVLAMFIYWTAVDGEYWDLKTKVKFHQLLDCPENATQTFAQILADPFLLNISDADILDCDEAFLVWVAPLIYFTGTFVFSGVLFFLYRAEKKRIESKKAIGVEPLAQVFMTFILLSLLGLWVAASIASATQALGNTILSLSLLTLILMVFIAVAIFGVNYLKSQILKTSMGSKAFGLVRSDWGKAMGLLLLSPLFVAFLCVDFFTQLVRRKTPFGKPLEDEEEGKMIFTRPVTKTLNDIKTWDFGHVIPKSIILGIAHFVLSVGVTRITLVFLSYMREVLLDFSLAATTGVLTGIGLIMFLLPPVPGVPVYITAGIILPTQAENEGWSFGLALVYANFMSLAMKLIALVLQQKGIGELWGSRSVTVRQAVGVNSVEIRAIRKALSVKGWSWTKIVILCGGPDWPTSVLTGILKLNLFEMLLGTVPVIVLIAPCVISGAMLVKSSENPDDTVFSSINTISVYLTVVVQSGALLGATQVIASTAVKYEEELKAEEPDYEVLALEEKNKVKVDKYSEVTEWKNLGTAYKWLHVFNLILMIVASYAFELFGSDLFVTFDITDSIDVVLGGNVLNLVTELGWGVIGIFTISSMYYFIFRHIHQNKRNKLLLNNGQNNKIANATTPATDVTEKTNIPPSPKPSENIMKDNKKSLDTTL